MTKVTVAPITSTIKGRSSAVILAYDLDIPLLG